MAALVAAVDCFSADITTLDGKTYKDALVTGVEADGDHISFRDGVVKVPFDQLPQGFNNNMDTIRPRRLELQ